MELNGALSLHSNILTLPGTGPRHGASALLNGDADKTFFYVIGQLDESLTGYKVDYSQPGQPASLNMTPIIRVASNCTYRDAPYLPTNTVGQWPPAEVLVTNDGKILVSSRNRAAAMPKSGSSDVLSSYQIFMNGSITAQPPYILGGAGARSMPLNKDHSLLAVTLQWSSKVVVLGRSENSSDLTLPVFGEEVASFNFTEPGSSNPVSVIWAED